MADTAAAMIIALSADVKAFKTEMERAVGINSKVLRDILDQHKKFQSELSSGMKDAALQINKALETIGAGVSVAGFVAFVKQVMEAAQQLKDLSLQSSLTTDTIQALQFAGLKAGISFEEINSGAIKFNQTLGDFLQDQSGPGAKAFEELGIKARIAAGEFHNTQEVFAALIPALSKVKDNATLAADAGELFGRQLGPRLVPLIRESGGSLEELIRSAKDAGVVLSSDLVGGAADANTAIATLVFTLKQDATRAVADFAPQIVNLTNVLADDVTTVKELTGAVDGLWNKIKEALPLTTTWIGEWLKIANYLFNPITQLQNGVNAAREFFGQPPAGVRGPDAGTGKAGAGTTGQASLRLGPKAGGRAPRGPSADELKAEADARKRNLDKIVADEQKALDEIVKAQDQADVERLAMGVLFYAAQQKLIRDDLTAKLDAIDADTQKEIDGLSKLKGLSADEFRNRKEAIEQTAIIRKGAADVEAKAALEAASAERQYSTALAQGRENVAKTSSNSLEITNTLRDGLESVGEAGVHGFKSMQDAAVNLLESLAQMALKLYVMEPLLKGLFPGGTGSGSFLGSLFGLGGGGAAGDVGQASSLGARASGGPVTAGRSYIVGEHRPELFVPNVSGMIMPNVPQISGSRGAPTIHAPVQVVLNLDGAMDAETMRSYARSAAAVAGSQAVQTVKTNLLGWYQDQAYRSL